MLDTVAPVAGWHFRDAAPVPGRHRPRYLADTRRSTFSGLPPALRD